MRQATILKDLFGRAYALHTIDDGPVPPSLKPEVFTDKHSVKTFVWGLEVPTDFWRRLVLTVGGKAAASNDSAMEMAGVLLMRGKLRVFKIAEAGQAPPEMAKLRFKSSTGEGISIVPATELFRSGNQTLRQFADEKSARQFIRNLAPDAAQMNALLGADAKNSKTQSGEEKIAAIAQRLISQESVVLVAKSPAPAVNKIEYEEDILRPVELAPSAAPSPQAEPQQEPKNKEAEQAQALIEAAASGAGLCEEC